VDKLALTNFILLENLNSQIPHIYSYDLEKFSSQNSLTTTEQFNLFMRVFNHLSSGFAKAISVAKISSAQTSFFVPMLQSLMTDGSDDGELRMKAQRFVDHAVDKGLLAPTRGSTHNENCLLTYEGAAYLESFGKSLTDSDQIFVAMWFGSTELDRLYAEVIEPAVRASGYNCIKIDNVEHNEKIDDEIIKEIRKSKAVVADITCGLSTPDGWSQAKKVGSPRGGVFFEAGFAKGLGLPVIWMVKNKIAEIENVGHFDIRQFNQIRWTDDFDQARERLQNRLEATLGAGNYKSN
jgi:hypothetical protein